MAGWGLATGGVSCADVIQPRNGSWTDVSVRFSDVPARRDDDAGFTLRGEGRTAGAPPLARLKIVQSHS
jgi:hypothetical protein